MKQNPFLLSIVIPTRNRENYAYAAAMLILENTTSKVQVVLQDNSDEKLLLKKLEKTKYLDRIKYNYSSKVLSFVENFSRAIEIADGEYICMIGDDDGINPEIELFVEWAKENNIEAINPEIKLNYIWPNTGIEYYKKDNGNLMIIDFDLKSTIYSTQNEIEKLLKSGGQNYLRYNLVKIYHGIVKKTAMDKVKNITGKYFGGLSPDIYSSIALSLVIDQVLKINYPLTIPGVCRKSGSGHSSTGRHHGALETAPQLVGHTDYKWSNLVPKFYSVETLWADSAIAAFRDMKRFDLLEKFNVPQLSVYCFARYKDFKNFTQENLDNYFNNQNTSPFLRKLILLGCFFTGPVLDQWIRAKNRLKPGGYKVFKYDGVKTIHEAHNLLKKFLKEKKVSILNIIKKK